jgi:hypothetical protein
MDGDRSKLAKNHTQSNTQVLSNDFVDTNLVVFNIIIRQDNQDGILAHLSLDGNGITKEIVG